MAVRGKCSRFLGNASAHETCLDVTGHERLFGTPEQIAANIEESDQAGDRSVLLSWG